MGSRVPVQHYDVRSAAASFIGSASLHDLNAVGSPASIPDVHCAPADGDGCSDPVDCLHESFGNSLAIHSVGVEEDRSTVGNSGSSRSSYNSLTIKDVSPIESARARFLNIIVDHFICDHVIEVVDNDAGYASHSGLDKLNKRKSRDLQYEGDPRFALPLMYVANMYETLVNDVNLRLESLSGVRDKTIGVALEAAGGLYRKIAKKFPKKGSFIFRRRELATSLETRTRFPELVIQEEKRVRFVVVNGLDIVEKPNSMLIEDLEWFKRLTGRNEVSISAGDYKFYSPRHKYRRVGSNVFSLPPQNSQSTPSKQHAQQLPHQPQFHPIHQNHHSPLHHNQAAPHYSSSHSCVTSSPLSDLSHSGHSPTISQNMGYIQPITGGHIGGRLDLMPTSPAKFCDECGAQYLRETSKFCSECGTKRLGT